MLLPLLVFLLLVFATTSTEAFVQHGIISRRHRNRNLLLHHSLHGKNKVWALSLHHAANPATTVSKKDDDSKEDTVVVVAGATGYIGRNVVRESIRRDYKTIALVRNVETAANKSNKKYFSGCTKVLECDVCDPQSVQNALQTITKTYGHVDSVISCLASRSGIKKDAYAIDYKASLNVLEAAINSDSKVLHYCLLSAFCVQKPELQFQHAKLKLEAKIRRQNQIAYSIIRPTAFFKSVAGQFENIKSGKPIVLFGDGESAPCNPIAESDLANYMLDCIPAESHRHNTTLAIGGSGDPVTHKTYNTMMSRALSIMDDNVRYIHVPIIILDAIVGFFQGLYDITGIGQLENAAEVARIIRYYAVEPMLTIRPEEKYGTKRLEDYYDEIARFGQEYDPYVSVYSAAPPPSATTAATAASSRKQPTTSHLLEPLYNATIS
eukprot:scaffold6322_cov59-Cylindrotheca_fusiformis.AAC.1